MLKMRAYNNGEEISFEEVMARNPYLKYYVYDYANKYSMPKFLIELTKDLREEENPNIIYPTEDPIFVHIHKNEKTKVVTYNIVLEDLNKRQQKIYDDILDRIVEISYLSEIPKNEVEVKENFIKLFEKVTQIGEKKKSLFDLDDKIFLSKYDYDLIFFHMIKNRLGYGKLEPMLKDKYIEDISCLGVGNIWLVHKVFGSVETNVNFVSDLELNQYVVESSERVERPISDAHPIVDAIMPDGSRVNYIFSKNISLGGSSFTIRKFNETPINIPSLVNWGTLSSETAAYLWLCLENDISIFICGETASGKTTTLNAMASFIPYNKKLYTVEQTPEILVEQEFWQHLITRESGQSSDVTMFDLLIASLRSRPDYIIIGEIRGKEANITFQAMQTGHPVLSTFHAGSVHSMVQRLTGDPINIPIAFIDNLNIVLIQAPVYINGRVERRILSLTEIIKYDDKVGKILSKEVFQWDHIKDIHNFRGLYNSHILENKIAKKLGLKDTREIYEILNERKKIIEKMVENKILDNKEILKIFKLYKLFGISSLPFTI